MENQSFEEQIRLRAYLLWEAEGCQQGHDHEYWEEALVQLRQESDRALTAKAAILAPAPSSRTAPAKSKGAPKEKFAETRAPQSKPTADKKAVAKKRSTVVAPAAKKPVDGSWIASKASVPANATKAAKPRAKPATNAG
jgi:hypothetical protein